MAKTRHDAARNRGGSEEATRKKTENETDLEEARNLRDTNRMFARKLYESSEDHGMFNYNLEIFKNKTLSRMKEALLE